VRGPQNQRLRHSAAFARHGTAAALPGRFAATGRGMKSMSIERSSVESDRTLALVAYGLHLFGAIAAVPSIVGLIVNYVKRNDYDELFDSHHSWMIRSFWWAILWCVLGFVTLVIGVGFVILFVAWLWYIYRHVRGLIALLNGEPLPR
jgi:uncharacterized membrane protein